MSHTHHLAHLLKETKNQLDKSDPLRKKKNPLVAALLGFLFGPFGVGIYLESWRDFFLCFAVLILLVFTGVLAPVGWIFSAAYGFYRASSSNDKGHA